MKKKILFIVNPISGGQNKALIPSLIDKYLDHKKFDASIIFSDYVGHAYEIATNAVNGDIDIVASVGGDGTINEIASAIESSDKCMAIVPCGSGNGLARTLKIPLKNADAIKKINQLNKEKIDCGVLNGRKFFNMAGLGFDAHISALFAKDKNRGLKGYVKATLKEISNYKAQHYQLIIDGVEYEREGFMLSIANSSQYGNNAHISPKASVEDGLLDVCIIKPFPIYAFPALGLRMFSKSSRYSKYLEIIQGTDINITRESEGPVHLDGEPMLMPKEINITVKHLSLNLIV